MRGQRGRLSVQALGYVNSTKAILGLPETAGVHFLLRPHHYILKDVRAKFSNIDFFLKILPLKDDELAMSEM